MSRFGSPSVELKTHVGHAGALKYFLDPGSIRLLEQNGFEELIEKMNDRCDDFLDAVDGYLLEARKELWESTSVYSGNTRGSLKVVGHYPDTIDIILDKNYWLEPKVLRNIVPRTIHSRWMTKHGEHTATYYYEPGKLKVKITGEDYAPRIPLPPHGGGNIDMLIAVYEEMKKTSFNKHLKSKGF